MKRVYISGKIGEEVISDATRRKFARAEEMLSSKGRFDRVFNPADRAVENWLNQQYASGQGIIGRVVDKYSYCLIKVMTEMAKSDAVYFLDDWRLSPGARAEYYTALAMGKRLYWQDWHDACEYLVERMYAEAKAEGRTIDYDGLLNRSDLEIAYFTKHLDEAWLPIAGKEVEP